MLETYLISVAIKSTILLAAGWLLVRCVRRRNARTHHLICLTALAGAGVVPLLARWSPRWSYRIGVPATGVASGFSDWPAALATIWFLGALIFVLRWTGGRSALRHLRQSTAHFIQGEVAEVRIGNVNTPLTCGVLRPLIILPRNAPEWNGPRLQAVLLHESAHIRRRDCLAKYVASVSRAMLWWNPLAWMLAARMHEEQERACDEAVLSAGVAPEDYAQALLDTARECSGSQLLGCAMSNSSMLRARLEHLFVWRPETTRATYRIALAIPLLLAIMTGVSCAKKTMPAQIAPGVNVVTLARPNVRQPLPQVHR